MDRIAAAAAAVPIGRRRWSGFGIPGRGAGAGAGRRCSLTGLLVTNLSARSSSSGARTLLGPHPAGAQRLRRREELHRERAVGQSAARSSKVRDDRVPAQGICEHRLPDGGGRPGVPRPARRSACVTVFVPTTPNATAGFLVVVPRAEVMELDMSVEEAHEDDHHAAASSCRDGTAHAGGRACATRTSP